MNTTIVIIILVVSLALIWFVLMPNSLKATYNRVENSFSNIDVQLEKRFDEIGQKLDIYMSTLQKESTLQRNVAALRSGITQAQNGSINDKVKADSAINGFMAMGFRTEGYPTIEAVSVLGPDLYNTISADEKELAAARRQYNKNATRFNTTIIQFPMSIIAKNCAMTEPFVLFKASDAKREPPRSTVLQQYNENHFNDDGTM